MIKQLHSKCSVSLFALLIAGCAVTPAPQAEISPVDAGQTLQQRLAAAQTSGITDTNSYSPVEAIGRCDTTNLPKADRGTLSPALAQALAAAQEYSDSQKGQGLIVLRDGQIIHETYGTGITADTPFVSQSLHKSLLGMTVLAAIDDGVITSLDDPLSKYIPEWQSEPRGKITLRQSMQMVSGLELYSMSGGDKRALEMNFGTDLNTAALSSPLADATGTTFTYNNANAQIVGMALSNALQTAGKGRYSEYLRTKIWCPLGNGPAELRLDRVGGSPQFFAGVHANLRDWAKVGEAIRNGKSGQGDASDAFDAMMTPSPVNPNYGLFLWLGSPPDGKRRYSAANPLFIPHSAPFVDTDMAFMDGFGGQRVYVSRNSGLVIARFGEVSFTYDDAIIPNLIASGLAPSP